jgi:ribonuclease H2 subunit A
LNETAHDATIHLIHQVIASGVNLKEVYVDTVGVVEKYQAKLQGIFPRLKIVVAKKADSLYPTVIYSIAY